MSLPRLNTAEEVLQWAADDRVHPITMYGSADFDRQAIRETAAYLAECVRLRQALEDGTAADVFDFNGNAAVRYHTYLRDAMRGEP